MKLPSFSPTALPRVVALDLDGTLLTSDKRLTQRTIRALTRLLARNVEVVICTGRPPRHARSLARQLPLRQPLICFNGAALCDHQTGAVTVRHRLPAEVAAQALRRLRQTAPGVLVGLESEHGWYLDEALFQLRTSTADLGAESPTGVGAVESFLDGDAVKILAQHPDLPAATLAAPLADLGLYRTWSTHHLLELLHPRVNKREGLEELCTRLGVARDQVAAFGDQRNDVEMLRWAGHGFAMGNASDEAKAAADEVIADNDREGVAAVIEAWLADSPAAPGG